MKKIITVFVLGVFMVSCGTSKNAASEKKSGQQEMKKEEPKKPVEMQEGNAEM